MFLKIYKHHVVSHHVDPGLIFPDPELGPELDPNFFNIYNRKI
jgi:hypothetical protein